jgi:AraC-like DNA-binding protein/quercetin dioxygenase-like cupin family protein
VRHVAPLKWQPAYNLIEPQINAEGVHIFPFHPDFAIDVRFLTFAEEAQIRTNRHDYFELLYLHSGEVVYQVQDRSHRMLAGDLFVMGSMAMHRMSGFPRGRVKAAVLYFLPELIRGNDSNGMDIEYLMPFLVQHGSFPHVVKASTGIPAQVFDLMRRASAELPGSTTRGRLSVQTYLKMMLVLLVNHYSEFRGTEDIYLRKERNLQRLRPVFEHIDHHYASPITVQEVAARMHMSKSSFMRFFKQVTGQSFITYLNQFRVTRAQALLKNTDKSIAEVSQEVGFCDQSYFGLLFRKLTGRTPREYKYSVEEPQRLSA